MKVFDFIGSVVRRLRMRKRDLALVVQCLAVALVAPSIYAQQSAQQQPPLAAKKPHATEIHGYMLEDDYFWLREKSNPEVIKYLESENAYTEEVMKPTKALQETIYNEMLGRIKQTDLSVPSRIGEYFYYSRTEEGKQYLLHVPPQGQHGRRLKRSFSISTSWPKVTSTLASGRIRSATTGTGWRIRPTRPATVSTRLHIKDLRKGATLAENIERVGSVVWATDNKTLFYTTEDPVSKRSDKFWRHAVGAAGSDLLYEEKDELFDVGASRSLDKKVIFLGVVCEDVDRVPISACRRRRPRP